jgi:CRISPR-associated protein Csx17
VGDIVILHRGLDSAGNYEFHIARALASIIGGAKQRNGEFAKVQPMLGSVLPLKRGPNGWYLPTRSDDLSKQAVWSGTDLCHDLARVLARRYLDFLNDDVPAVASPRPAPLEAVLAFLRGELDDQRIARWTEALSLIDWRFEGARSESWQRGKGESSLPAIPHAYAALRSLLEVECEWQTPERASDASSGSATPGVTKRRRSPAPISLVCQRSSASVALSIEQSLLCLSIWGVPNPYGKQARTEKKTLAGRDIVRAVGFRPDQQTVRRLAAAILIPLDWHDRWKIFHHVTLPQNDND